MSFMISNTELNCLAIEALIKNDDEQFIRCLETASEKEKLSEKGRVLMGITLMMPPFGDYYSALKMFLMSEKKQLISLDAAIWHAYLYTTLYPENNSFDKILEENRDNEISSFMLAQYYDQCGKHNMAIEAVNASIQTGEFPNNLILKAQIDCV
ncbi:MAG: hypothetical protein CR997_13895 [Acidobacteria bacterium]|nr:MAG: hypothetical protein CR997_13895 [Acidobacteriota bacterium]